MPEPASASADLARLHIERREETARGGGVARLGLGLAAVAAVAAAGWLLWDRVLKPLPAVQVFRVPSAGVSSARSLDASGYLVPQRRAEVATKSAGVVAKVYVDEGDTVAEGQALAELTNDAEKAYLEEAEVAVREAEAMKSSAASARDETAAAIEAAGRALEEAAAGRTTAARAVDEAAAMESSARRDWERNRKLFESRDIGEGERDAAEAAWKAADARRAQAESAVMAAEAKWQGADAAAKGATARAAMAKSSADAAESRVAAAATRVKQAKIRLEDTIIRSPIAGRVIARKVLPGEAASPAGVVVGTRGGALFTVADFSTIEAEVDVNETRLSELREKQPAWLAVDAIPSRRYRGELRQIVPTADRQRAVVRVRVRVLDADVHLMPEMAVRVTFVEDASAPAEAPSPLVPSAAVVRSGGAPAIWVVLDGRAKRREVEVGAEKDGKIEVKRGISGGELVVVANTIPMEDGMKVKAEEK